MFLLGSLVWLFFTSAYIDFHFGSVVVNQAILLVFSLEMPRSKTKTSIDSLVKCTFDACQWMGRIIIPFLY